MASWHKKLRKMNEALQHADLQSDVYYGNRERHKDDGLMDSFWDGMYQDMKQTLDRTQIDEYDATVS